jgi:uncharacterized sporulation protein YeaH/YhbH (DUF444 family)
MTRKVGDIIEFSIMIDVDIPEEDLNKEICVNDYKREYKVSYDVNNMEEYGDYTLDVGEGEVPPEDDIKNCVELLMEERFPEVAEYEILELNNSEYEHQTGAVKVVTLK